MWPEESLFATAWRNTLAEIICRPPNRHANVSASWMQAREAVGKSHAAKSRQRSTSRYKIFRLVHFETFGDIRLAIAREKEIKGWRREKKVWLIERDNPTREDLAERLTNGF